MSEEENRKDHAATERSAVSEPLQVNSQIVDAVRQTRNAMRIDAGDMSRILDAGINYNKAGQAAAIAVQDAADYLRNVMTITSTAQGMALKLLLETKDPLYGQVLEKAIESTSKAVANFEAVGKSAASVASSFPR